MKVSELLAWGVAQVKAIAPDSAAREAGILLAHLLGGPAHVLTLRRDEALPHEMEAAFRDLIARRLQRCPVQYLTGECEFYGLKFKVGPGVLIPRPETELLVERAIAIAEARRDHRIAVLEVGVGSGCISVALAVHLSQLGIPCHIVATDVSEEAIRIASQNARRHSVGDDIAILQENLLARGPSGRPRIGPLERLEGPALLGGAYRWRFDLLVSNPPYVSEEEFLHLEPEVRDWEPREALVGGNDGLEIMRRLLDLAPQVLLPQGCALIELGAGQAETIRAERWASLAGAQVEFCRDLAGIERVMQVRMR